MNLTAIIAALQAANSLLPEVVTLIQGIEKAFPNATVDAKLNSVIAALQKFETAESELSAPISIVTSLLSSIKL